MPDHPSVTTRRRVIGGVGAGLFTAVAGCIEGPGGTDITEGTGYAAFFTLADWGNRVGGEHFAFETPVDVGEIGHGWEPGFDVVAQVAGTEVFLYLDSPEFAWAQDLAGTLADDHPAVTVADALVAIPEHELLTFDETRVARPPPDHEHEFDPETFTLGELELIDRRLGSAVADFHYDHWHGGVPDVPLDDQLVLDVHVEDSEGRAPPLGEDERFRVTARIADGAPGAPLEIVSTGDAVSLHGRELGETSVVFELVADDEVIADTAHEAATVSVVDAADIEVDAFYDPHVWVDPVLAKLMVGSIAETLAGVDPANADAYEANASAYLDQIEGVHQALSSLVDEAPLETVVFAGHDSFGYVANRYGIEFHTPVGVSAHAEVSLSDVSNLAQVIEARDIETVLYDPFEAPDPDRELPPMVEVLLEDTGASRAEPLSPAEGTTPAWRELGYGWLEQWTEINLPSLSIALGAGPG